jgi:exopolysaccharide biosynthesis polyprenyl glycosylphosphotransferase
VARVETREIASSATGNAAVAARSLTPRTSTKPWSVLLLLLGVLPAAGLAVVLREGAWPAVVLATCSAAMVVRTLTRHQHPVRDRIRGDVQTSVAFASLSALAGITGVMTLGEARACVAVAVTTGVGVIAVRLLQPPVTRVRTVVLVGGESEIAAYVAAGHPDQVVAGCLVVDAGAALAVQPSLLVPTTTSIDTVGEMVRSTHADDILILPGAAVEAGLVRDLSWMFQDTPVTLGIVHPVTAVARHRLRTRVNRHGAVLELRNPRATFPVRATKHLIDRLGAAVLLVLVAPIMLTLWMAVFLETRGPGFFVQTRIGRDGRPFRMFKFRTMHLDAESLLASLAEQNESDGMLFKIRRDPRVTRVGYWLRRYSLDELPQLFNVLRGEMSLVGPRPALPNEVSNYDEVARRRLVVKPGITGLWQVSGRSDLTWEQSLILDLYYADNWRLRDDFAIAARTLSAVIQARGAY